MMAAGRTFDTSPLQAIEFEPFRSRLREAADLSKTNWFRVGGPAQWLFRPENAQDLASFLKNLPRDIPITVLGVGSNLIVRDGGIEGVVIKLGRGFTGMGVNDHTIEIGAGALSLNAAQFACEHGIAGLEFLSGIPGTVGGAVRMNAGAYGSDTSQVLIEATIVERDGTMRTLSNSGLGFVYRNSDLPEGAIVTSAMFQGHQGNEAAIAKELEKIRDEREASQPVRARTGGSTFKNPEGRKAWELIDQSGCRGLKIGAAQVSEKHCNFLINTGAASARDIEALGEEVRRRVKEKTGITLEWEIKRIGKTA